MKAWLTFLRHFGRAQFWISVGTCWHFETRAQLHEFAHMVLQAAPVDIAFPTA